MINFKTIIASFYILVFCLLMPNGVIGQTSDDDEWTAVLSQKSIFSGIDESSRLSIEAGIKHGVEGLLSECVMAMNYFKKKPDLSAGGAMMIWIYFVTANVMLDDLEKNGISKVNPTKIPKSDIHSTRKTIDKSRKILEKSAFKWGNERADKNFKKAYDIINVKFQGYKKII